MFTYLVDQESKVPWSYSNPVTGVGKPPQGTFPVSFYGFFPDSYVLALQTILLIINWFSWFYFQSRAALSLLGYCYFQVQSFEAASDWLVKSLELRKRGNPMWYGLGCLLSCFGMSNTDFALAYGVDDRRPWNASWLLHLYCKKKKQTNKLREALFVYVKVASFRGEIMLLLENYWHNH